MNCPLTIVTKMTLKTIFSGAFVFKKGPKKGPKRVFNYTFRNKAEIHSVISPNIAVHKNVT